MKKDLSHFVGGGGKQEVYIDKKGRVQSPHRAPAEINADRSNLRGFTLPEMLIVVGLVGVILGIAIPGYKNFSTKANMESSVDKLTRVISFARNRALTTYPNTSIVVCPSVNTEADNPTCEANAVTDYSTGWITFIDCNGNRTYQVAGNLCDMDGDGTPEATELLLQRQSAFNGVTVESGTNTRVQFFRTGQAAASTTFEISKDGKTFADIAMNAIGRVQVALDNTFYYD